MNYWFLSVVLLSTSVGLSALTPLVTPVATAKDAIVPQSAAQKSPRLDPLEVETRMQSLPDWSTNGKALFHVRVFQDFVEAMAFVNSLVDPAEQLRHHPNITVSYNQVSLMLTTHDAQGLTELDFQLAEVISKL